MEKRLTQDEILALLEGQEDILTPAARQRKEWLDLQRCPVCNGRCIGVPHPAPPKKSVEVSPGVAATAPSPFVEGQLFPLAASKCTQCSAIFDPHTRVIFQKGEATLIQPVTAAPKLFVPR